MDDNGKILISPDATAEEIAPIAMAIHEMIGLPISMRSLNKPGVRIEKGKIIDSQFTGPILEQVMRENKPLRIKPSSGVYKDIPVSVAPIHDTKGNVTAAIGVVDALGTIELGFVSGEYPRLIKEIHQCVSQRLSLSLF